MAPQLPIWQTEFGEGALVACAVHDGHTVRDQVADYLKLDSDQRLYEEDPYTSEWARIASTRIVALRSRFEIDFNRPREKAVYITPADAWGLDVWRCTPPAELIAESLRIYDEFYAHMRYELERLTARHRQVVVFDLHSYNHIRGDPTSPPSDPAANPEVNLGTGTMNRDKWAPVVDRWLETMRSFNYLGRQLDVRENVKFFGGQVPRWIHENFPDTVCTLAIEVKKFFMNEWTGELDPIQHETIGRALTTAAVAVEQVLETK